MRWRLESLETPVLYDRVLVWPRPDLMGERYTAYFDGDKWTCEWEDNYQQHETVVEVTHWMPLPRQPQCFEGGPDKGCECPDHGRTLIDYAGE